MYYKKENAFDGDDSPIKDARYIAPLVSLLGKEYTGKNFHEWWMIFQKDWDYIACFHCGPGWFADEYFIADNLIDLYKEINKHFSRYSVVEGFNTKQLWVYDEEENVFIDPPSEVLNKIKKFSDIDDAIDHLENICNNKRPDWLNDKDYWFDADNTDI